MENFSIEKLSELYFLMLKIRKTEEKIIFLYPEQEIRCPTHLYIGQEAVAVGVCANLKEDDAVFTNHRSHGHYLAKGGNLKKFFSELYGKESGCAGGYGGSMHLIDKENGIWGASAIVGGIIPIAVGAALSFKLKKEDRVAVVFFGDGAVEEGVFHESSNFASLMKLPIVFVCENNFFAVQTHLSKRESNPEIWKKAAAYNMPGVRVDGTKILEVFNVSKEAVGRARKGEGPTLIEATAYRWMGHVGIAEDYSMGHRTEEELDKWKTECPLKFFEEFLLKEGFAEENLEIIKQKVDKEIDEVVKFVKENSN